MITLWSNPAVKPLFNEASLDTYWKFIWTGWILRCAKSVMSQDCGKPLHHWEKLTKGPDILTAKFFFFLHLGVKPSSKYVSSDILLANIPTPPTLLKALFRWICKYVLHAFLSVTKQHAFFKIKSIRKASDHNNVGMLVRALQSITPVKSRHVYLLHFIQ